MEVKVNFGEFMQSGISGKFVLNNTWIEYLLNLFHQGYFSELYDELAETKLNHVDTIDNMFYSILGTTLDREALEAMK